MNRAAPVRTSSYSSGESVMRSEQAGSAHPQMNPEVLEAIGFEPGGAAPFPQKAVSRTLMDRSFLQHPVVWIGAGTERHMAAVPPLELARLTRAAAIDL